MNFYSHNTIKKYTKSVLDLFNDFKVKRIKKNGGIYYSNVPIIFGQKEKIFKALTNTQDNINSGNVNSLPMMSLLFDGLSKDSSRQANKHHKNVILKDKDTNEITYNYNPITYDFDYTVYLITETLTDMTEIIEQIAPMFNPDYTMRIKELDYSEEIVATKIKLGGFSIELDDVNEDENSVVECSFPLTIKGRLHHPIINDKLIETINIDYKDDIEGF